MSFADQPASIVGNPTKPYDGITAATLTPANFQLNNLAPGDSFTVTQTVGFYNSVDTNAATVSTSLSPTNFSPGAGTLAADYVLPTSASGAGTIAAKVLTATIVGNPTKTYDGTGVATLTPGDFQLSGLVGSDSFIITQPAGTYNSKDTNASTVSASLSPSNFFVGANTPAPDYALPTIASGPGTIQAAALTISIIGDPTKAYDGTTTAVLTPGDFQLTGVIPGESLTVTQTTGAFDGTHANAAAVVSASLSANNFAAGPGTLLSDYVLPTSVNGSGTIVAQTLTASILGEPRDPMTAAQRGHC